MPNTNKPTKDQANKIKHFINLAFEYNKTHNLFVRTSLEDVYETDVKESLTTLKYLTNTKTLLDIGTGAGLPGMVIGITRPNIKVTHAESNRKKTYFIKKTIHTLGLTNAEIKNKAISSKTTTKKLFDVITARALAPTPKIICWSAHLLAKNGKYVLLKGALEKTKEEVAQLDNNTYSYNIHKTNTKDKQRHILEITKK